MGVQIHRLTVSSQLEQERDPVLEYFRGWNNSKTRPRGWLLIISGETQTGKSTMAGYIAETIDPMFIPSLQNHPVFTKDNATAVDCHLSVSLIPFLLAVRELMFRKAEQNQILELLLERWKNFRPRQSRAPLGRGSVWIIDEPDDVDSKRWYTKNARAIKTVVGEFANDVVNLIVLTRLKDEALTDLRKLAHFWINVDAPGHGEFWRNGRYMAMKSPSRKVYDRPWFKNPIEHAPKASAEFHEAYSRIKEANKVDMLGTVIEEALKGDKRTGIV